MTWPREAPFSPASYASQRACRARRGPPALLAMSHAPDAAGGPGIGEGLFEVVRGLSPEMRPLAGNNCQRPHFSAHYPRFCANGRNSWLGAPRVTLGRALALPAGWQQAPRFLGFGTLGARPGGVLARNVGVWHKIPAKTPFPWLSIAFRRTGRARTPNLWREVRRHELPVAPPPASPTHFSPRYTGEPYEDRNPTRRRLHGR